jgi:hypothetical protein
MKYTVLGIGITFGWFKGSGWRCILAAPDGGEVRLQLPPGAVQPAPGICAKF